MSLKHSTASLLASVAVCCLATMPYSTATAASEFQIVLSRFHHTELIEYKGTYTQIEKDCSYNRKSGQYTYSTRTQNVGPIPVYYNYWFFGELRLYYLWLPASMPEYSSVPFEVPTVGQSWFRAQWPTYQANGSCNSTLFIYNPNSTRETCTLRLNGARLSTKVYLETPAGLPSSSAPYDAEKVTTLTLDGFASTNIEISSTDMVDWTGGSITLVPRANN